MRYSLPPTNSNQTGSLASMIDIIFLLIIFFVVTASMDNEQLDLSVSPPKIRQGMEVKNLPPEHFTINILDNGTVKIGYKTIPADMVKDDLRSVLLESAMAKNTVIIINGAETCRHKHIASVLEAAANAGFDQVRINAEIQGEKQ